MEEAEKIAYQDHPSLIHYLIYIVIGSAFLILFFYMDKVFEGVVALAISIIVVVILRARHLFTVTVDRVTAREGLISRDTTEIQLRYVMGTHVKQGIVERILGIGSVEIFSAAETSARVLFRGIRNPVAVKDMINRMIQGKES